ncbi:MAG: HU family DNA-binding protein [Muribaculaceae bacterium]|nr:HU family DNA-binding protein [Muribaculaceae bacterium]
MKKTIAFPQLVELVAQKANTTERMSELFLQELFAVVTQELTEGKSVTIKGVGTFKTVKDDSGKDVVFIPDKDLAEAANAPFAQFEPLELCDEVTDEMLREIDASMEQPAQNENEEPEPTPVSSNNVGTRPASSEDNTQKEDTEPVSPAQNQEEENVGTRRALSEPAQKEPQEEPQDAKSRNPRVWLIAAAAAAALIAVWYFYTHRSKERSDKATEVTQVAKDTTNDTKNVKPKPIVTDTISGSNVIFTMAKKHYGDQAFWVYIARENQALYPDYRKIPVGTVLIIPPAEKYGINSDSKQSLKQANAEAMKLYKEVKAADKNEAKKDEDVKVDEKSKNVTTKPSKKSSLRHSHYKKHQKHYRHR